MINPNYIKGRFLFIVDGCPHCAIWETFLEELNIQLRPDKRIKVIDCTYNDVFGVNTDSVIKLFETEIDGYPILIIDGTIKSGAENIIECKAWLKARIFHDFIFPQSNEFLPIINKYVMFNKSCKYNKGRVICE